MFANRMEAPDLDRILQRGLYPELVERAMVLARPVLAEAETSQFRHESDDAPVPIDMRTFSNAVGVAVGSEVGDMVVVPDDLKVPRIQQMAKAGRLNPQKRFGDLLHRAFGGALRGMSDDVKRGLHAHLGRVFRLDDEKTAMAGGFDYAARVSRRDALSVFIGLAVIGDERLLRRMAGLVQCLRWVTPLAIVDQQRGLWLAHRV